MAENPQDKHGRHVYDADAFGLDSEVLRRNFSAYRERFGSMLGEP